MDYAARVMLPFFQSMQLEEIIKNRIRTEGPMSFRDFMHEALYHPGLGYYTSALTEIGKSGDFYTSPHLHSAFGAMIGRQAIECWELMGRPSPFAIIEPGSGRGYLAMDMLDYLKGKPIYEALTYNIVELNPGMRERQSALLASHLAKLNWHASLADIHTDSALLVSNEVPDAFPVHVLQMSAEGWREVFVALDGDRFTETLRPPTPELAAYCDEFVPALPEGFRIEANLQMQGWIRDAASTMKRGFILTVDYGYPAAELYNEDRPRGTLLCYKSHMTSEDFYSNIGAQDITAHVNFSALAGWGSLEGLDTIGFARQGAYLVSLGIDELIVELYGAEPNMGMDAAKIHGLIMPGTMGDTHKVLMQCKGVGRPKLRGFSLKNQAEKLFK